jgi:hypothetical protein
VLLMVSFWWVRTNHSSGTGTSFAFPNVSVLVRLKVCENRY